MFSQVPRIDQANPAMSGLRLSELKSEQFPYLPLARSEEVYDVGGFIKHICLRPLNNYAANV